jgi:hypothetical protein
MRGYAESGASREYANHIESLLGTDGFKKLAPADKDRVLDVFDATDATGRQNLITLADRQVNGQSALLDKDKNGDRLLDQLNGLRGGVDVEFSQKGVTKASLMSSILEETADPARVNQDSKGTCTVTSMQYMLAKENPAEYARISRDLVGVNGAVTLRDGSRMTRVGDSVAPDSATNRSPSERVFQAAMMNHAGTNTNGSTYSNTTDSFKDGKKDLGPGLRSAGEKWDLEAIYGKKFAQRSDGDAIDALKKRSGQLTFGAVQHWSQDDKTKDWSGHAVVFTKVENDRVYFRNPWGIRNDPAGTTYTDPPRRLEDPWNGIESMSVDDFKARNPTVFVPKD